MKSRVQKMSNFVLYKKLKSYLNIELFIYHFFENYFPGQSRSQKVEKFGERSNFEHYKNSQVITQTEALDNRFKKLTLEGSQGHPSLG